MVTRELRPNDHVEDCSEFCAAAANEHSLAAHKKTGRSEVNKTLRPERLPKSESLNERTLLEFFVRRKYNLDGHAS